MFCASISIGNPQELVGNTDSPLDPGRTHIFQQPLGLITPLGSMSLMSVNHSRGGTARREMTGGLQLDSLRDLI